MRNLYSVVKICIASALLYCRGLCACFLGQARRYLNCVDAPLNPTHSLTHIFCWCGSGRHLMNESEGRDESSAASSSTWDFGEPVQKNPCFCGK